ncbi:MAG: DNA double-strand break repair nuclease NurA [Desulfurococcales archaeon]|nr:DNA double-strand break repair nuclease NurA [Desulfurococcales archaeon]
MSELISSVVLEAVDTLKRAAATLPPRPPPVRLLDRLIDFKWHVEEGGNYRVSPLEFSRRFLGPRRADVIAKRLKRLKPFIIGVDSSSRAVGTAFGAVVVGAVAVSHPGGILEWPPIRSNSVEGGPPFVALVGAEPPTSLEGYLRVVSPGGDSYVDYSVEQVLDELRLDLENWALGGPVRTIVEEAVLRGFQPVVLVDGPVYPVTMAFQRGPQPGREDYWRSMESLLKARRRAVEGLERLGAIVVGVVKRIERSTIISRLAQTLGENMRGLPPGQYGDAHALYHYYQAIASQDRLREGRVLTSIRAEVLFTALPIGELDKVVEYIVIPPGKWNHYPGAAKYYRTETSPSSNRALEGHDLRPSYPVVWDSVVRGSLQPISVAAADRVSSGLTRALTSLIARHTLMTGLPLTYSSEIEMGLHLWRSAGLWASR